MQIKKAIRASVFAYEKTFMTKHISSILDGQTLALLDVGAAGDIETRWKRIDSLLNYIGFEPDSRSHKKLQHVRNNCNLYTLHNKALWSHEGAIDFHFCQGWQQSSHFQPNQNLVKKFPQEERFKIEKRDQISVTCADNLIQSKVDFIKIDTQGGELDILGGSKNILENVFGLELELEIAEIYTGQPTFQDIVHFLKEMNFVFVDFVSLRRWERQNIDSTFGQLVFGDGLFIRSPEYIAKQYLNDTASIDRYVAICCLYNRFDLIKALEELIKIKKNITLNWRAINKIKSRASRFVLLRKISDNVAKLCGSEFSMHGIS